MPRKIPAAAYIIIGAGMILMSVFIDIEKLSIFILAGAIFIVIGFLKIIMAEKKHTKRHTEHHVAHHAQHQHAQPHAHSHQETHHAGQSHSSDASHHPHGAHQAHDSTVFRCASCHVKVHPRFKFCPNCGHKIS